MTTTTTAPTKESLKALVQGLYDLQKIRIQTGNRIVANRKVKLGLPPSTKEDKLDKESKAYLEDIRTHYHLITNGLLDIPTHRKFKADGVFDDYTELNLAAMYTRLYNDEKKQVDRLEYVVKAFPIWEEFLKDINGVGPMMAGVIISGLDPHKALYPSSFHAYAGLDVVDNKGRSRKAEHLIDKKYIDKEGKEQTKKSITFNPWVKTKLVGVLASCFVRQEAAKSKYRRIYDDYKKRLENHKNHKDKSKGHRNAMAKRYIIKMFLIDLHCKWRELEGLPVSLPYHEAKLGYKHAKQ